jgi:hypothetical protein
MTRRALMKSTIHIYEGPPAQGSRSTPENQCRNNIRDFYPPAYRNFINQQRAGLIFLDSFRSIPWVDGQGIEHPAGWVSHFGKLNGGVYFLASIENGTATVSWDFSGLNDWFMQMIFLNGLNIAALI